MNRASWFKKSARGAAASAMLLLATAPAHADGWWQDAWSYRKVFTVDATGSGLNLAGAVGRTPVLVRLHSGNFSFADAAENGSDLRFVAGDDKTPLTYHIENFDPLLGVANVWVDIPKVTGGEKTPIYLYYGNKSAPAAVNTGGTFDPDYTLVLHYDEAAGTPTRDKTAYGNNPRTSPSGVNDASAIGRGAKFAPGGAITIPASPSLSVAAGAPLTFSTWVKTNTPEASAALFQHGGLTVALVNDVPTVTAGAITIAAPQPITAGQWSHVAAVANGETIKLFVNGVEAGSTAGAMPAQDGDIAIGGTANQPFSGELDETRLSKTARPAALIAADANVQGAQNKLLVAGEDQKPSGGGGGVLGFIFSHISGLDWGIIGLCMALLLGAIFVMVSKARYLAGVDSANQLFLKRYRRMDGDLVPLSNLDLTPAERTTFPKSPLARIYESGIEQVETRNTRYGNRPLSGETVEAIRSELDAQQTTENQKFDRLMVLLTIAISGGPFIGLLGTVIGVMTTFGGVALAGDVNVNAIAPGIAAALLATIAGLSAAIPSLFGYNYLNSRISTISDEMRVFVDRLVTRLAETQAHRADPPTRLAAE